MSLKINTRCATCKEALDYLDTESKKVFRATHDHDVEACKDHLYNTVGHLQERVLDLTKRLEEEQLRAKEEIRRADNITRMVKQRVEELTNNLVKAPIDQKTKLVKQCRRWQALYERERHKRRALKQQIMHVYGTLDFRMETGCIVDPKAKVVTEYTSNKLRDILRKAAR